MAYTPEELETNADEALAASPELPPRKLLSFYDRLRERIVKAIEKRRTKSGGKLTEAAVHALLLVPDVFILLVRLALDKEVPASARALIGGALAYFVLPADLLPELILGGVGFLDDLILATAVLAQAFGGALEPYASKHWSGKEDLRVVIRDLTEASRSLLGESTYERLRKVLAKRGVKLE